MSIQLLVVLLITVVIFIISVVLVNISPRPKYKYQIHFTDGVVYTSQFTYSKTDAYLNAQDIIQHQIDSGNYTEEDIETTFIKLLPEE